MSKPNRSDLLVLAEQQAPEDETGPTGTGILRLQNDRDCRHIAWLYVFDPPFGLTVHQARRLGQSLLRWAKRRGK